MAGNWWDSQGSQLALNSNAMGNGYSGGFSPEAAQLQFNPTQNFAAEGYTQAMNSVTPENYNISTGTGGATGGQQTWWQNQDGSFNTGLIGSAGKALGGVGSLAQAWIGYKGLQLAKENMKIQQEQWDKNYAAQRQTTNNRIRQQNAAAVAGGGQPTGQLV